MTAIVPNSDVLARAERDAPDIHQSVTFLLDHLPPQVTIAITTRADPPLPLARLRGRGELLKVRAADLRFTAGEADAFLNHVMGLGLDPAYVTALEHRTGGWAAGLQLAALSARGRTGAGDPGGVAGFVDAFTGSHRFVLDYLVEEVLNGQPDDVRGFLLDTSVLQQMTGALCDALTAPRRWPDRSQTRPSSTACWPGCATSAPHCCR
jgi:LuxR family maltose regulon positive regulatory protein